MCADCRHCPGAKLTLLAGSCMLGPWCDGLLCRECNTDLSAAEPGAECLPGAHPCPADNRDEPGSPDWSWPDCAVWDIDCVARCHHRWRRCCGADLPPGACCAKSDA